MLHAQKVKPPSTTVSTEELFKQVIPTYKEVLQKTGYKYNP